MIAQLPEKEAERLDALRQCRILNTEPEDANDDMARLAAFICGTPYAAIALIDAERQWFKSLIGLSITEMPRETSFCALTILQNDLMTVHDALSDPRFLDDPLVTGIAQVRFYAGIPLVTEGGHALGSLFVADRVPRRLTPEQDGALQMLGRQVGGRMEMAGREMERESLIFERELTAKIQRAGDESLRQLGAALESTNDGIIMSDAGQPDHPISYANPAFLALTGYQLSEVIGRNCRFLQGDDTDPDALQQIKHSLSLSLPCHVTLLNYRKDGSPFWNELTIVPVLDDHDTTTHFVGIQHDITALKESEAALQRSQARLVEAQRIGGIGDWELDVATRRFTWSAELFRQMEIDPADGEPSYDTVMSRYAPEDRPERDRLFTRALEKGEPCQCDIRLILPSGTLRWWHLVGHPTMDADGVVVQIAGTAADITDRKVMEAERERLLEETERLLAVAEDRANRDPLTRLLNHRAFHSRLAEEAARAEREGLSLIVAVTSSSSTMYTGMRSATRCFDWWLSGSSRYAIPTTPSRVSAATNSRYCYLASGTPWHRQWKCRSWKILMTWLTALTGP